LTEEPILVERPSEDEGHTDTVGGAFARLYADGRAYADAEIARQKLRAGIAATGVRDAAIFAVAGAILVFAGLVAFLVGLVLVLAPHIGAEWAAGAVFGSTILVALILLLLAKTRISRMRRTIKS